MKISGGEDVEWNARNDMMLITSLDGYDSDWRFLGAIDRCR